MPQKSTRQMTMTTNPDKHKSGLSRRGLLTLLGAGGASAVLATSTVTTATANENHDVFQDATPTPTAMDAEVVTPAADRLHVKPVIDNYYVAHGTSVEMRWHPNITRNYLMDASHFFIRNHSATPIINPDEWQLTIEGPGVDNPIELSYEDLLDYPANTVTRFVECAGNGRGLYDLVLDNPGQGTQWTTGGYGVGTWTGIPLSSILEEAGLSDSAVSIMASGMDETGFEKPLPIEKAMDDVMLIYGMNYGPLPYDHGFPLRLLVPGWVGSYNVKWLGSLLVGDEQLYSTWNTTSYVLVGPAYEDPEGPPEGEIIREQTIKSVIALPWGATLEPGEQRITGYAWSPYASIATVEVSFDEGETYEPADLIGPNIGKAGARWEYTFDAEPGEITITTRATDTEGNTQWPVEEQEWNEKGYVWGAVIPHPITVSSGEEATQDQDTQTTATPTATATGAAATTTAMPTQEATPTPEAEASGQRAASLAETGHQVYSAECAECHGDEGRGQTAPALIGTNADLETYGDARGLFNYIRSSMPQDEPGSLSDQEYLQVLAYLLLENEVVEQDRRLNFDNLREISLR